MWVPSTLIASGSTACGETGTSGDSGAFTHRGYRKAGDGRSLLSRHLKVQRRDTARPTTKPHINQERMPYLRRKEAPKGANPEVNDKPNGSRPRTQGQ